VISGRMAARSCLPSPGQAIRSLPTEQAQARAALRAHPNKVELARHLGVDRKTLWRYATGARPIPPHLLPRILTPAPRSPERQPVLAPALNTPPVARRPRRPGPGGGGPGGPPGGGPTHPGTPSGTRDRSGGPAGRARSERQRGDYKPQVTSHPPHITAHHHRGARRPPGARGSQGARGGGAGEPRECGRFGGL